MREGGVHLRDYQARPAVLAFTEASRVASGRTDADAAWLRDLATLSLARTFYSSEQYDLAAKYYAAVAPDSRYWRDRLFEAG